LGGVHAAADRALLRCSKKKKKIAKHKTHEDCWIVIRGVVYDVTKFLYDVCRCQ